VLVESLMPKSIHDDDFYGDIEEEIDDFDDDIDHETGSVVRAKESSIDPSVLSLAEEKLRNEMVKPFEQTLDVPWVAVSGMHAASIWF
jgi:hypothetical protein